MRLHEIMGIESNRRWGVCSLNEFRKVYVVSSFLHAFPNLNLPYSSLVSNVSIRSLCLKTSIFIPSSLFQLLGMELRPGGRADCGTSLLQY